MSKNRLRDIIILGLFISISVVLTRYASLRVPFFGVEGVRFGFGKLPIILSGIIFGPILGFVVGALADIIGYAISPIGAYMPHFTLTSALNGLIPGIIVHYLFRNKLIKRSIINKLIFFGILISQLLIELFMIPYFLNIYFKIPWKMLMIPRLITTPVYIVFYYFFIVYFIKIPIFSKYNSAINTTS